MLAFFRSGGQLAGKWGWLAVLRQAQLGDEVQFLEGYAGFWPAPGPGASIALRGTFAESNGSLYIQGAEGSLIAGSEAAKTGNAYLLARPSSDSRLPTVFGPYYASQIYWQYRLDLSRVDLTDAALDVFGPAGEAVPESPWPLGAPIYALSEAAELYGWARAGQQAKSGKGFGPLRTQAAIEFLDALRKSRVIPAWGPRANIISLIVNLSGTRIYRTP